MHFDRVAMSAQTLLSQAMTQDQPSKTGHYVDQLGSLKTGTNQDQEPKTYTHIMDFALCRMHVLVQATDLSKSLDQLVSKCPWGEGPITFIESRKEPNKSVRCIMFSIRVMMLLTSLPPRTKPKTFWIWRGNNLYPPLILAVHYT